MPYRPLAEEMSCPSLGSSESIAGDNQKQRNQEHENKHGLHEESTISLYEKWWESCLPIL